MGFVYHGNYAQFYEIGRTESIRALGFTYKDIEAMGIIMPVVDIHSRFIRPARYDDLLTVTTTLRELPCNHKIVFHSEIFNEASELLNSGIVTLFFMEARSMQKTNIPSELRAKVEKYFST
jgi:acyl-CoA thioester hydrolase